MIDLPKNQRRLALTKADFGRAIRTIFSSGARVEETYADEGWLIFPHHPHSFMFAQ
jgi:hypothetical protein